MKKYIKLAAVFAAAGLCAGVFYREFSKCFGITNEFSVLGLAHTHFLMLGVFAMLVIGLVSIKMNVSGKLHTAALICYTSGTAGAGIMLVVRGVTDILSRTSETFEVSKPLNGMISGISGIFHVTLGVGLTMLFICWLKSKDPVKEANK